MSLAVTPSPVSKKNTIPTMKTTTNQPSLSSSSSSMVPRSSNNGTSGTIDFMGSIPTIKHLLTLPYQEQHEQDIAVALHNVGNGTLLLEDASCPATLSGNNTTAPSEAAGILDWNYQDWQFKLHSTPKLITNTDNDDNPNATNSDNQSSSANKTNNMLIHQETKKEQLEEEEELTVKQSYADAVLTQKNNKVLGIPYPLQTMVVPGVEQEQQQLLLDQFDVLFSSPPKQKSEYCSVVDSYLDTLMNNVPQLAYSLSQKGFHSITPTSTAPSSQTPPQPQAKQLFSKITMDTNANMLLHFLKSNCTSSNTTYLLYKHAKSKSLQLYNINSLPIRGKAKWVWWLATLSNRFASRLQQFSHYSSEYRQCQRNLLWNALELFQEFADLQQQQQEQQTQNIVGGKQHQSLCASVCEQLADTYLIDKSSSSMNNYPSDSKDASVTNQSVVVAPSISPSSLPIEMTSTFLIQQRYTNVTADGLTKATDHLLKAIQYLKPLVSNDMNDTTDEDISMQQMKELREKLIHVSFQLAKHHLKNYFSSSAMQALRIAARALSKIPKKDAYYFDCWLWELCGHFARSFAADILWRERGHTCGDDIISLLQDIYDTTNHTTTSHYHNKQKDDKDCNDILSLSFDDLYILLHPKKKHKVLNLRPNDDDNENDINSSTTADSIAWEVAECMLEKQNQLKRDKQRVLVASVICYSRAILTLNNHHSKTPLIKPGIQHKKNNTRTASTNNMEDENNESVILNQRLGDACNEIGKLLLIQTKELIASNNGEKKVATGPMILSAARWFQYGLKQFEKCHDFRNVALLRCNLSQCSKVKMSIFTQHNHNGDHQNTKKNNESCLEEAADHLEKAHAYLERRDSDNSVTWDMVSEELAATFLVLGVRRRQTLLGGGTTPLLSSSSLHQRLTPGKERSIVEPMERAKDIYTSLGNHHQSAAASYQLALFYSKVWTCQRDESKTRQKLATAFQHFSEAHQYFFSQMRGNEPTFVILCLDLSNLYSAVSIDIDCLSKSLLCCLDTCDAFSPQAISAAREQQQNTPSSIKNDHKNDWFPKMKTLERTLEERIFKLLMNLVKLEKTATSNKGVFDEYKKLYRVALTTKMSYSKNNDESGTLSHNMDDDNIEYFFVHKLLQQLKQEKIKMRF